jgi:hypothetical protein
MDKLRRLVSRKVSKQIHPPRLRDKFRVNVWHDVFLQMKNGSVSEAAQGVEND